MTIGEALGQTASIYNLGLAVIAVWLFIKLFTTPVRDKRVYILPWKILFIALLIYMVEELLTVLRKVNIIDIPAHINGFFELVIITTFIYTILIQREHMKKIK